MIKKLLLENVTTKKEKKRNAEKLQKDYFSNLRSHLFDASKGGFVLGSKPGSPLRVLSRSPLH